MAEYCTTSHTFDITCKINRWPCSARAWTQWWNFTGIHARSILKFWNDWKLEEDTKPSRRHCHVVVWLRSSWLGKINFSQTTSSGCWKSTQPLHTNLTTCIHSYFWIELQLTVWPCGLVVLQIPGLHLDFQEALVLLRWKDQSLTTFRTLGRMNRQETIRNCNATYDKSIRANFLRPRWSWWCLFYGLWWWCRCRWGIWILGGRCESNFLPLRRARRTKRRELCEVVCCVLHKCVVHCSCRLLDIEGCIPWICILGLWRGYMFQQPAWAPGFDAGIATMPGSHRVPSS